MPIIKPISDLRNKSAEISNLARSSGEPVFITKNGEGDMVVMSMDCFHRFELKRDLFEKLAVAQREVASGSRGEPLTQVMKRVRSHIRARS